MLYGYWSSRLNIHRFNSEIQSTIQVKYTNRSSPNGLEQICSEPCTGLRMGNNIVCFDLEEDLIAGVGQLSLSFSGSNQARKGRLVDALAVRGDEGRDTLR